MPKHIANRGFGSPSSKLATPHQNLSWTCRVGTQLHAWSSGHRNLPTPQRGEGGRSNRAVGGWASSAWHIDQMGQPPCVVVVVGGEGAGNDLSGAGLKREEHTSEFRRILCANKRPCADAHSFQDVPNSQPLCISARQFRVIAVLLIISEDHVGVVIELAAFDACKLIFNINDVVAVAFAAHEAHTRCGITGAFAWCLALCVVPLVTAVACSLLATASAALWLQQLGQLGHC